VRRTLVLNVVGLTSELLGEHTPRLKAVADRGTAVPLRTITPAVTCSVQSTFTTGTLPREHGCVANGWYFRDLSEIWLWRQSNRLVAGEKIWETAKRRDGRFKCAKMFWWYNMYSSADISATPRPIYRADGRKLPDCYTHPMSLRDELTERFGTFPLFDFWGPRAGIASSKWIADATRYVWQRDAPTLGLVYLPHLDYGLQRLGPDDPAIAGELRRIDEVCGELIDMAERDQARVVILSEYGITKVERGIHVNRALRDAGLLAWREELGEEHFDAGASQAFAVVDHQIAHVYVADRGRVPEIKALLEGIDGVERVLDDDGKREVGLDHPRSGELVAISRPDRWFTYYWWHDDRRAPDFARTVDIHRKPGYDPVELFLDPSLPLPKIYVAARLVQTKLLGLRRLLDVIPLDDTLVRGSHGRPTDRLEQGPVLISNAPELVGEHPLDATDVKRIVLDHVFA
jgi:predicted AlkP superfamily pyrophosphatase or phosphodiesterase